MNHKSRSLTLSIVFTTLFAVALAALTVSAPWVVEFLCEFFHHDYLTKFLIVVTYCAVPAGWGAICLLYKILFNVKKSSVFILENVHYLNVLSWLCIYVGIISTVASFKFIVFLIVAISALFIGLIIRVVRNIIHEAIEIKEENDMTI